METIKHIFALNTNKEIWSTLTSKLKKTQYQCKNGGLFSFNITRYIYLNN